jgi:hypothetical protein
MNKIFWVFLFIACIFVLTTCQKEQDPLNDEDYIIFGHYYGECQGEQCVEIFKLTCCRLYEDTKDKYPDQSNPYVGSYIELDAAKYDSVRSMINRVPSSLLSINQKVIGMPDAGDWGGLYFEIKRTGEPVQYWFIDQMKSNVPASLHTFIDDINTAINKLQ